MLLLGGIWEMENDTWNLGDNNHNAAASMPLVRQWQLGMQIWRNSLLGSGEPNLQRRLRLADTGRVWRQRHMRISVWEWPLA